MFKVMLACEPHCESWENVRETLRTEDPVEAIKKSEMHRDQDHTSWVESVEQESKVEHKYHFTASRPSSGLEGDCVTFQSLLRRLGDYDRSFPNELTEVHITRIGS